MKKQAVLLLALIIAVCCCACTNDVDRVFKNEGGEKAFLSTKILNTVTLADTNIVFAAKALTGDYAAAFSEAVEKLNAVSDSFNISVDFDKDDGDFYVGTYDGKKQIMHEETNRYLSRSFASAEDFLSGKINVADYRDCSRDNGFDNFHISENGIDSSNIFFNTAKMDSFTYEEKLTIMLHELGHSIGLKDFYDDSEAYCNNMTVMRFDYSAGMESFTDYTEFDKRCIKKIYG